MMMLVVNNDDIQIEQLGLGAFSTNAYVIVCQHTRASIIIDAPADADIIIDKLMGSNPRCILLTHNHMDHTGALSTLHSKLDIPVAAHADDARELPITPHFLLNHGDTISHGSIELEVLHTPGHTHGSLSFRIGKYLFSGDTIFPGGPGKTWSPPDFQQILDSITKQIFTLSEDTEIYPGHGDTTMVKKEKEEFAIFSSRPHDPLLYGDVLWLST